MDGPTYTKLCEGFSPVAKQDTPPAWEKGYGFDYVNGIPVKQGDTITLAEADAYFPTPYNLAQSQAAYDIGPAWNGLDPIRQAALADMAYEMGGAGLSDFHHMIAAIQIANWQAAHDQCLASSYGTQVSTRAHRTAYMLLTGQWPEGYNV